MHGTKVKRSAAKAAAPTAPSKAKKEKKQSKAKIQESAEAKLKAKRRKEQLRGEIANQQPLSTAASVAKQMAHAQAQLQVKALPTNDKLQKDYAKKSTQGFKRSMFHYHQVPEQHADMILMGDTKARRHEQEMIRYVDSPLLKVNDPVLRETIRQEENEALKADKLRDEKVTQYILSTLTGNDKVKAMIKAGASNKTVLNAMYNLLPRIMPTRKLRHNVDQLDWLGQIRHRWQNEIEPNGYDVEDSSDPDTLPQQRPFTRDEMHRLLQDVEESRYIESDIEENLFAPAAAIGDLKRELQAIEIDNQLRFVLKNHQGPGTPPESFNYKTMRRNFKLLLGSQQTAEESLISQPLPEVDENEKKFKAYDAGHDGTPNELSQSLSNSILEVRNRREKRIGVPYLFGSHAGAMDAQDFLLPATITNAGLGLMPPMFDVLQLPVHYIHDATEKNEKIDMFNDAQAPFQSRFDIACAVVLNRIMGPGGKDIPVYLTDSISAETKLKNHPKYRVAQLAMLKDLKAGTNTAVESIQALMKEGFHPQDVMKRLVKHLDQFFDDSSDKRYVQECHFDMEGEPTGPEDAAISFTGDDFNRLADYHRFINASMKTAKIINETEKYAPVAADGQIGDETRTGTVAEGAGSAAKGLLKSSKSKVDFENYQLQTDADGNFISVIHATSDTHPESMIDRSQLAAQEYGIGNVHRATPTQIDLSNNLGIAVTEPEPSPFGFRPNQKTIYGKQIAADQDTLDHEIGGLASREVPATRFTTDGTEISLDPHRAAEYSNKEMLGALDNYHKFVKPRIAREQMIADETSELFQPGTHGLSELLRFQLKNDPDYLHGYDTDETDQPLPDYVQREADHFPDVSDAAADGQGPIRIKQHLIKRRQAAEKLQIDGPGALNDEEKRSAYRLTRNNLDVASDDSNSYTDLDIALGDNSNLLNSAQIRSVDDIETSFTTPHLTLQTKMDAAQQKKVLADLLNDPYYREADINWAPLTNFSVQYSKFLLNRFEKKEDSREKKFRAFCKSQNLELTEWDSDFNKLIRRVFDGDISDQLTHAARQVTREEQLAALVPIFKDWKKVLEHDRSHLLNPTDAADPAEREFRAQSVEKFLTNFRLARAQIRLTDEFDKYAHVEKPGYGAIAAGAVLEDYAVTDGDKIAIDSMLNLGPNAKKIKVTTEAGEVASVGTIVKPVTDVRGGFAEPQSLTTSDVVPEASGTLKLHKNKYTLFDLFEGRLKIQAGGDNAPAITDFDFRAHYMDKVTKDVEAFNTKYYTREEFSSFEDLLKTIPEADKLPPLALKLLKAKSQITSTKFVNFKRNDTAYQEGDVDPITGRELKIKSLGLADVDSPISEELLGSIQRHHRVMLNQSDTPHQFNVDINSYLNALESNGGDRDAALAAAEQKTDMIPNDALSKQLKRYLQAWRASDIEAEAIRTGQGHVHEKVGGESNNKPVADVVVDGEEGGSEDEVTPEAMNAADDHVIRIYSRYTMGYDIFQDSEFKRYAEMIEKTGEMPPALKASTHLRLLFKEWQARDIVKQLETQRVFMPVALDTTPESTATADEIFDRPDQGLGYQHLHRTPDKEYQKTMDLPVDGDEMDHLRDALSKNVFDPLAERNLDDRVEWFNEPEMHQSFDHKTLTTAIEKWMNGDPFLQYLDTIPPGIKEAEVLRSSFSMIPPRLLDAAIRAKEGDEDAKFGRRRNLIRYNPAFSNTQIRKFRRGLEKYSGIPLYLLDFAEVAFNPHRPFFVHASQEENHLRHMMTEERLRQPARPLIAERPEDSDNDTPGVSTPITIGGTPASRQAAHVQNHYQSLQGTERLKRIQKFKKDLSVAQKDELYQVEPATELDEEEANIAQDMFQKALDRLLQRNATAFLTSDYDMDTLRSQYGKEMAEYEIQADRRRRLGQQDGKAGGRVRRTADGTVLLGDEIGFYDNGFVEPVDTSDEEEWLQKFNIELETNEPGSVKEFEEQTELEERLIANRLKKFRNEQPGERVEVLDSDSEEIAAPEGEAAEGGEGAEGAEGAEDGETAGVKSKKKYGALGASDSEWGGAAPPSESDNQDPYAPLRPREGRHAYFSTKYPFALQDFTETFEKHLEKTDPANKNFVQQSAFTRRVLEIQNNRLKLFDKEFLRDMPLNTDPAGLDVHEAEWQLFFDRKSQALPILGRHRQTLRVMAESYLRHRRLTAEGKVTGDYAPHPFELAWTFERLYGLDYFDTEEERVASMDDYRAFIRANRPRITLNGDEVFTDDDVLESYNQGRAIDLAHEEQYQAGMKLINAADAHDELPEGDFKVRKTGVIAPLTGEADEDSSDAADAVATGSGSGSGKAKGGKAVKSLNEELTEADFANSSGFDADIAKLVEEEAFYRRIRMNPEGDEDKIDIEQGSEEEFPDTSGRSRSKKFVEDLFPISQEKYNPEMSVELLKRNHTLGHPFWDDAQFFSGDLPDGKTDKNLAHIPLTKRPGTGLGLAEHFDKLPRAHKVEYLMTLLRYRHEREARAARRDDIVSTVFGTQRQLMRRLSDELQLVKRAERTAFKRIFALDPDYARELVSRHLMYSTGRRHVNDPSNGPVEINWKVELNYIEEIMWSSANRLNARTGGMFPGTPGVNRAHDKTFFTPPPLIAGEFAPMFVDQNMISSGDEYEQARTRLQYHGNADFVACGVTQWRSMGKKKQSLADERHLNDDTKAVLNTRRYIDDGLARDAIMQLKEDFSQYEFTSDVEAPLIENSIAQLSLDAGTNMAFASAIATHRKRLDDRRAKIETEHPLFYGTLDPNVDWHGGDVFGTTKTALEDNGSPVTLGHTHLRHRLKSLMRGKGDLNLNETPIWSGLYAVDHLDYNEDGTPGDNVNDLLEGLNSLIKRTQKVNALSSGHLFATGSESRSLIMPHSVEDTKQFFDDKLQHLDAPFDTNGTGTAAVKAAASKKVAAAADKATAAKSKATTDVLGQVLVPSKYSKFDAKALMAADPELETLVKTEQALQRHRAANFLLQANALTVRLSDQVNDENRAALREVGVNLLPQALIDEITLSVLGGKGGARLYAPTAANIAPFIQSPTQILGDILALRPGVNKNTHSPIVYNIARTTKQENDDLKKIQNHEFTEWSDVEIFASEDEEKPIPNQPPHLRFAKAIRDHENRTKNALLAPITDYDGEIARGQTAEPTHPGIKSKVLPHDVEPKFNPKAHLAAVLSSNYNIPMTPEQKVKYRSNPIIDKYPELRPSFEKLQLQLDQENGTELTVQWAPGGVIPTPKPLAIPDHANPEDVQDLLRFDDVTVKRPLFQQLRRSTRDVLKGSLPSWMRDATRDRDHLVTAYTENDGDITTVVHAADEKFTKVTTVAPGVTSTATGSALVPADSIRQPNVQSSKGKILRQRAITAKEALAMGLDPNSYEGILTRMQKDFVDERLDELFAASDWAQDPTFTSNKYLRSMIVFTGLRKLEADPQVGATLLRDMLRGADIEDESSLYSGLNLNSFYKYVRAVEKEDKLQRMGKYEKYKSIVDGENLQIDSSSNPLASQRSPAERLNSPMLDLVRDIVDHAEAFGEVSQGLPISTKQPTYNPFSSVHKFDKHSRIEEEFSGNESDFENVMHVPHDLHSLTTVGDKFNPDFEAMHSAMVKTKKSISGLSIEEVEKIFNVADQQPPIIRQVIIDLLREYLAAYPQNIVVAPPLHIVDQANPNQNHTGHPLRNLQIMSANDTGSFIDQANPRGVFTLEEIDLSLVDMTQRFNMEHGNALPAEDLSTFNKIILDCAREGRVYYPKPKLHEVKVHEDGALPDGTIGFDTENLAIGKLDQFKPEDLRYSSDTVSLDTFNRIMALPPAKLQTFMAYQDYINTHAKNIAHKSFYDQLNRDIRAVRPHDDLSIADVADAQHVRKMHTDRSQFDKYVMAPNGYIRLNENRADDDNAILSVVSRAKYGRTKGNTATLLRPNEFEPETEDPSYNFRTLDPNVSTYGPYTKEIMKDLYRDVISGFPTDWMSDLGDSTELIVDGNDILEDVVDADRPEDADLGRRFLNMQHWLGDPLSPRQLRVMKQMYEERKLEAYWQGTMNPFDSADVYNNLRMADKMIDADTHMDHDRELARLHREIVIGVVREVLEDQDITMHSLEYDSYNLEPDFLPTYTHYDHVNVFAARRFSPYTTLPLSESNIPPMIGIEQQRNIYNLHLLDPVTFHPRWLARRLNVSYSQCIAILKTYDFRHRLNMHEAYEGTEAEYDDIVDGIDDSPLNPDFASVDLELPNPPEVQLSQLDEEYLYSRFAPNLIGRVSWSKRREREVERTDPGFRSLLGMQDMFGGDGVSMFVDRNQEYLTKRYMEEEKVLDALEQASFARFGPISYANAKTGELHRPPKMPREIISSSLHPPMRNNWALTTLDHSRDNTYGIMIRDRDGYLRHPTYREFRAIRTREKDRRVPFFWRRHHVLGKLPEISSLFVDQVTQIKADFDAKTNLAKDMRTAADLNFVKQINYTPIADADDVKLRASSDDPDAFDKQWDEIRDNFAPTARLNDSTIRARDWLGEYDENFRNMHEVPYTEAEDEIIKTHNKLSPEGKDWNSLPSTAKRASTPLEVRLRRKIKTLFAPKDGKPVLLAQALFSVSELEDMDIIPPPRGDVDIEPNGPLQPEYEDFFLAGTATPEEYQEALSTYLDADDDTRQVIINKMIIHQVKNSPLAPNAKQLLSELETTDDNLDPVDQLKDRITMKNIAARKAAESGKPYTADMAMIDEPSKQTLKDLAMLRKGIKPTKEMYHYQRLLARRGFVEDAPYGIALPDSEDVSEFDAAMADTTDSDARSTTEDLNGYGAGQDDLIGLYEAIRADAKPLEKMARAARKLARKGVEDSHSELSEESIQRSLHPSLTHTIPTKEGADKKKPIGFDHFGLDKNDPDYYRNRLTEKLRLENLDDPVWNASFHQRPDGEVPALLSTDNLRHYLSQAEIELEQRANGPKGERTPTYIATLEPVHTSVGAYLLDASKEALSIVNDSARSRHQIPMNVDELRLMTQFEQKQHKKLLNDQLDWTDTSKDELDMLVNDMDAHLNKVEESDQNFFNGEGAGVESSSETSTGSNPTDVHDNALTSDSEWSRNRPDNEYSYRHHNEKTRGVHNRDVSEDPFHDALHLGRDMYNETYGIPRSRINTLQKEAIEGTRETLNAVRADKLGQMAAAANRGERAKYKTLRKALLDPSSIPSQVITRVPTTANLAENDPALAEYLNNVQLTAKPKPNPYGGKNSFNH